MDDDCACRSDDAMPQPGHGDFRNRVDDLLSLQCLFGGSGSQLIVEYYTRYLAALSPERCLLAAAPAVPLHARPHNGHT